MSNTEALQAARDLLADMPIPDGYYSASNEVISKLDAALAQPAASGEPVAWLNSNSMRAMTADEKTAWLEAGRADLVDGYTAPLYTAQPAPAPASGEPADSEAEELQALNDKLAGILSRTVVALRGPEPPLTRWSWHDLPERAAAAIAAIDLMQRVAKNLAEQPDTAQPAPAPPGWRLVPEEPTEAMQAVIRNEHDIYGSELALYAAMLAAAPDGQKGAA